MITYSSGKDGLVGTEPVNGSVLEAQGNYTTARTVFHDQIKGEVLHEELRVVLERLAVEGVQDGMSCPVSGSTTTVSLSS